MRTNQQVCDHTQVTSMLWLSFVPQLCCHFAPSCLEIPWSVSCSSKAKTGVWRESPRSYRQSFAVFLNFNDSIENGSIQGEASWLGICASTWGEGRSYTWSGWRAQPTSVEDRRAQPVVERCEVEVSFVVDFDASFRGVPPTIPIPDWLRKGFHVCCFRIGELEAGVAHHRHMLDTANGKIQNLNDQWVMVDLRLLGITWVARWTSAPTYCNSSKLWTHSGSLSLWFKEEESCRYPGVHPDLLNTTIAFTGIVLF